MEKTVEPAVSEWSLPMAFEADRVIRTYRAQSIVARRVTRRYQEAGYMGAVAPFLLVLSLTFSLHHRRSPYMGKAKRAHQ